MRADLPIVRMWSTFSALDDETRRLVLDELAARDGQTLSRSVRCSPRGTLSLHASGDLSAPRRARVGWARRDGAAWTFQIPLLQPRATRRDHRTMASRREDRSMRSAWTSVFVDDQRAALAFYTDVLGFTKRRDIPVGSDSWLTVVSPEAPDGPGTSAGAVEPPSREAISGCTR